MQVALGVPGADGVHAAGVGGGGRLDRDEGLAGLGHRDGVGLAHAEHPGRELLAFDGGGDLVVAGLGELEEHGEVGGGDALVVALDGHGIAHGVAVRGLHHELE